MGNITNHVEVVDVSTPATFHRYTNNWKGCTQGWEWLPGLIPETIKKELPGLKNFYMIGQWVMPGGGITSALVMGRDITRIICKRDKKKFQVI
jgi:phytoene dehydrogenase-like protein